jgi:HemY protein
MIRIFIFSLISIFGALIVTMNASFFEDPGYLLLVLGNYSLETTILAFALGLFIFFVIVRIFFFLLALISPFTWIRVGKRFQKKRKSQLRTNTNEGLLSLVSGNLNRSKKFLNKGLKDNDSSVLNYLGLVRVAVEQGENDKVIEILDLALKKHPLDSFSIGRCRAKFLYREGELLSCVGVLKSLQDEMPNESWLLKFLKKVFEELGDWRALEDLEPILRKHKIFSLEELDLLKSRIIIEKLRVKSDIVLEPELTRMWKNTIKPHRMNCEVVEIFALKFFSINLQSKAREIIEFCQAHRWSDDLSLLYGTMDFREEKDLIEALAVAERWLEKAPDNHLIMLTLARLSIRLKLWGKARDYYKASIGVMPTAAALAELSFLLKGLEDLTGCAAAQKELYKVSNIGLQNLSFPVLLPEENKKVSSNNLFNF